MPLDANQKIIHEEEEMSALMHKNQKVRTATVLAAALIVAWTGGAVAESIKVEPQCPSTITPGANLKIELKLTNPSQTVTQLWSGGSFVISTGKTFNIAKTGLLVHLGNLNVLGPYVIPLKLSLDPQLPYTYDPSKGYIPPPEEQSVTTTGYLNVAFPSNAVRGTFTHIGIQLFDEANKSLGLGACIIQVN